MIPCCLCVLLYLFFSFNATIFFIAYSFSGEYELTLTNSTEYSDLYLRYGFYNPDYVKFLSLSFLLYPILSACQGIYIKKNF